MPEEFMKKDFAVDVKTVEGERALNWTITTTKRDRAGDIVEAKGAKLANFRKNPVVLLAHDYKGLSIAKAEKLEKTDEKIMAKVVFPPEGDYPLADTVYKLYKGKFMRACSIGFIPIKSEDIVDDEDKDRDKESYRTTGRRIKIWELVEFSACAIGMNPDALDNQKMMTEGIDIEPLKEAGFIEIIDDKEEEELKDDNEKIEETEDSIRIPAKGEEGKHKGHKIRWITVSEKEGIRGIYCIDCKKIITFVFDKKKGWTLEKAKEWMADHGKDIEDIEEKELEIEIEERGVIPFKETPKAPEGEKWDAGKEIRQAEISDLKIMCAWFDSENPDIKTAYKLPHHKAKGHAVVWRAVAAAMGALLGARGGVAIPTGDKKGVYNHLAKHYKQFDKEPPELRDYEEDELYTLQIKELFPELSINGINFIFDSIKERKRLEDEVDELKEKIKELELKAGAVLNAKNKQNLKNAQKLNQEADALIQGVLDSAETGEDSLEIEGEKDSEDDDTVIDLEDRKEDDKLIDKEEDEKTIEVDEKVIAKAVDERMSYIIGKVKSNPLQKIK